MNYLISIFLLISIATASAATFVGNGGSALDQELHDSIYEMQAILAGSVKSYELADCESISCQGLFALTKQQFKFGEKFYLVRAPELLAKLKSGRLQFSWTSREIILPGSSRTYGAVAAGDKITINETVFASLSREQRLKLLLHEIQHTVAFQGKDVVDQGEVGPFRGENGWRRLLDVQGLFLIMAGYEDGRLTKKLSKVSSNLFHLGLRLDFGSRRLSDEERSKSFMRTLAFTKLGVEYYAKPYGEWGVYAGLLSIDGNHKAAVKSDLTAKGYQLGVVYRRQIWDLFGEDGRQQILGPSHYLSKIGVRSDLLFGQGTIDHKISDRLSKITAEEDYWQVEFNLAVSLPLAFGLAVDVGAGLSYMPVTLDATRLRFESTQIIQTNTISYRHQF